MQDPSPFGVFTFLILLATATIIAAIVTYAVITVLCTLFKECHKGWRSWKSAFWPAMFTLTLVSVTYILGSWTAITSKRFCELITS